MYSNAHVQEMCKEEAGVEVVLTFLSTADLEAAGIMQPMLIAVLVLRILINQISYKFILAILPFL